MTPLAMDDQLHALYTRACTTRYIHSQFSAMTVMTSIATAVVLPAALTIPNSKWVLY